MSQIIRNNIVAVATGNHGGLSSGASAIGIIRISGTDIKHIIKALTKQDDMIPRHAYYQKIYDVSATSEKILDIALVIYFQGPNSFTGEDVLEIQAHGNSVLLNNILECCLSLGCKMAQPGEFSQRAYLNGKMDLVQAESIADLINAQSQAEVNAALASMQGRFSQRISTLNNLLIRLRVFVEATLDFPEEDIEFIANEKVTQQMIEITDHMQQLLSSVKQGVLLNNGAKIVIVGQPNVGKSSLFNALADADVAIVTDIAGTTRDVLERQILIHGVSFNLLDTAGIRESNDVVEKIGVERAVAAVAEADVCLFVVDASAGMKISEADEQLLATVRTALSLEVPLIMVYNKIDQLGESSSVGSLAEAIAISVKNGTGLEILKERMLSAVGYRQDNAGDVFIARTRHLHAVRESMAHIEQGLACVIGIKLELLAEELRLAHQALGTITGEFSSDDLLGEIFSSFCIGK